MAVVEVDARLCDALKTVCPRVERLRFTGAGEVEDFITYQLSTIREDNHADDDAGGLEYVYLFDIYARRAYFDLLRDAVDAVKAAGFFGVEVDPELYENDTGYYHAPVKINYWEEL